jgi:hypothetical protein
MPPELDRGGQFAAFLEYLADGLGRRLINAEHGPSMGGGIVTGKRPCRPEIGPGRESSKPCRGRSHPGRITGMEIPKMSTDMATPEIWYFEAAPIAAPYA